MAKQPDTTELTAEDEGTEAERPEFLLEKFATTEDQAKGYAEAERRMTQLTSELQKKDEEIRKRDETFAEAISRFENQPQQAYNPSLDPLVQQYQQAVDNGDAAAQLAIQVAINQQSTTQIIDQKMDALKPALTAQEEAQREQAFQMAQDRMSNKYGDQWSEDLQNQVFERLRKNPAFLPQVASPDGYTMAMEEQVNVIEGAKARQQLKAYEDDRTAKLQAQGLTGAASRSSEPTDAEKAAWDEVKNTKTNSYEDMMNRASS